MRTLDVPQANDLHTVRAIVHAVFRGALNREALVEFTGFSTRHTGYRMHAARVLEFIQLNGDDAHLTTLGEQLLESRVGSTDERAVFHKAVTRCAVVQVLAPDLLAAYGPTVEALTERISEQAGLKASTARRRASCLLSWRFQALGLTPEADAANRARADRAAANKAKAKAAAKADAQPDPKADEAPAGSNGPQLSLFG
jgi:hypothetical protein